MTIETPKISEHLLEKAYSAVVAFDAPATVVDIAKVLQISTTETRDALVTLAQDHRLTFSTNEEGVRQYSISICDDEPTHSEPISLEDFQALSYEQVSKSILNAIDQLYCTQVQIKRFNRWPDAANISDVFVSMIYDKQIVRLDRGQYAAYFRVKKQPTRFWLDGLTCGAEFPDSPSINPDSELRRQKQAEVDEKARRRKESDEAALRILSEKKAAEGTNLSQIETIVAEPVPVETPAPEIATARTGKTIKITPEQLEVIASQHRTKGQVSVAAGYKHTQSFHTMLMKSPEHFAAYERGRAKCAGPVEPAVETIEKSQTINAEVVTESDLIDVETHVATDLVIDPDNSEPLQVSIDAEATYEETSVKLPRIQRRFSPVHSNYVTLGNGSQVLIAFEGNLLTLSRNDRRFIDDLCDVLETYDETGQDMSIKEQNIDIKAEYVDNVNISKYPTFNFLSTVANQNRSRIERVCDWFLGKF